MASQPVFLAMMQAILAVAWHEYAGPELSTDWPQPKHELIWPGCLEHRLDSG